MHIFDTFDHNLINWAGINGPRFMTEVLWTEKYKAGYYILYLYALSALIKKDTWPSGPTFSTNVTQILRTWLVEMAISTNQLWAGSGSQWIPAIE